MALASVCKINVSEKSAMRNTGGWAIAIFNLWKA
jgi:hypothetical protein